MSRYTGRRPPVREMPADFEEVYLGGVTKMKDLRERYKAGDATLERWIDTVNIKRAERIKNRR